MAEIFLGCCLGSIGLYIIKDCNTKRKNNKITMKLKKEMTQLELNIRIKIRNIKDNDFLKNLLINSEIDNYNFKTKCYSRLFENSLTLHEYPISYKIEGIRNDWNINKILFKDNLKRKLMNEEYYNKLHNQKLKKVYDLFNNSKDETKITIFKQYEEYIVYRNYKKNIKLLELRNQVLDNNNIRFGGFFNLNYIDEVDEPEAGF